MRSNSSGIFYPSERNLQRVFWFLVSDIAMVPHIDMPVLCLVLSVQQLHNLIRYIDPLVASHSDIFPKI